MKKFLPVLSLSFFFVLNAYAQGWEWGRGNTGGALMDSWAVTTDRLGNIFAGGVNLETSPAIFNLDTLADSGASGGIYSDDQCILAKYDSTGNFLWARGTQNGKAYLLGIAADPIGDSYMLGSITGDSTHIGSFTLINSAYPNYEYFLAKFDPSGNVVWAKAAGGAQPNYMYAPPLGTFIMGPGAIATDAVSNIYITSNYNAASVTVGTYTLTNTDPSGATTDILVAKYDSLGNVIWATSSGGDYNDYAYGLAVTSAGDVYITGAFNSDTIAFGTSTITDSSGGVRNAFIARYNAVGSPVWACTSGGLGNTYGIGLATDASNNVYLTGGVADTEISFSDTSIANPYAPNCASYLVKFDTSNHVLWHKIIGDPLGSDNVIGFAIAMSACNDIWVSGLFRNEISIDGNIVTSPGGGDDPVFIASFSSVGTYSLSAVLSSGADDQNGIACDVGGNVYMCADYDHSPFVVGGDTLQTLGAEEWQYLAKYKLPSITIDTTFQRIDTIDCKGLTVMLKGPAGFSEYLWSNGSFANDITVDSPGNWWVISFNSCASAMSIDSFYVKNKYTDTTFMSEDTFICIGIATTLHAPSGYLSYLWADGSTSDTKSIDTPGAFAVIGYKYCSEIIDSITAINNPTDTTYVTKDLSICKGVPVTLKVSAGYPTYLWNDNSTGDSLSVDTIGTYWVIGFSTCDTVLSIDTFIVKDKNVHLNFSLGRDTIICSPLTLTVSLPDSAYSYLWQSGYSGNSITVDKSGAYYVRVGEQGCFSTDTINVTSYNISQHLDDTLLCAETFSQYTMYANLPPGATALWSTGSKESSITVTETGEYWVRVTDAACTDSGSMILSTELCNCNAFLPNAFTPNDDGKNDTYRPVFETNCAISNYEFSIYNRYGQRVFYSENPLAKWDGTFQNVNADLGTYMYYLKYTTGLYSIPHEMKGDVTLVR